MNYNSTLKKIKILTADYPLKVKSGGMVQDSVAINDPSRLTIYVNRQRWNDLSSPHLQEAIALHEFLSLLKLENTGSYIYSSKYLAQFDLPASSMTEAQSANKSAGPGLRILSIQGASKTEISKIANVANIYGGLAGEDHSGSCANESPTSTCNTCPDSPMNCNEKAVRPTTILTITFMADQDGYPVINVANLPSSSGSTNLNVDASANTVVRKGQVGKVSVSWGELCVSMTSPFGGGSSPSCGSGSYQTGSFLLGLSPTAGGVALNAINLFVGTSAPTEGKATDCSDPMGAPAICAFKIYSRTHGAIVADIQSSSTFPIGQSGMHFEAVRFYYERTPHKALSQIEEEDFSKITANSSYIDLPIITDSTGQFSMKGNGIVKNLNNFSVYVFKVATVDQAGNINFFTAPQDDMTCEGGGKTCHAVQPHDRILQ